MLTVLYFGVARDLAGTDSDVVTPGSPLLVGQLRPVILGLHPALSEVLAYCRLAVNQRYADDTEALPAGAEVAVIPPVAGG